MVGKNIFQEVPNNYKSSIGKKYPETALTNVWDAASEFIRKNLQQGRGIAIKNLGTFTFSEWTTRIGNTIIETKQPIFLMSEKLIKFYNLKTRAPYTTGKTPVKALNYSTIAISLGVCRQMVEDCVTEITEALLRLLSQNEDVEVPFSNIGQLNIRNKQVRMNFIPNFMFKTNDNIHTSSGKANTKYDVETEFRPEDPVYASSPIAEEETAEDLPCEPEAHLK